MIFQASFTAHTAPPHPFGQILCVWHLVEGHSEALVLHFILACEECRLTSIHFFISQVFIEHLLITANLKLCAVILLSYAIGWSRSRVL